MKKVIVAICTVIVSLIGYLVNVMGGDSQSSININAFNQTTIYNVQEQNEPKLHPAKSTTKNSEKP
jgi:hypothetical protein